MSTPRQRRQPLRVLGPGDAAHDVDQRPLIRLRGGGLAEHCRDAQLALAKATRARPFTGVYARGSSLVRPIRLRDATACGGVRQAAGALLLHQVDGDFLRCELTGIVHFQRFDKRPNAWLDVDAPKDLALGLLAAAPWPDMPALAGIVSAPTLREDGSLLDKPGYDETTGLLFDPGGASFPSIKARPTRRDAEAALAALTEMLSGFPFADGASRSVALAALITGLVRRSLRSAPLFGFSAPKMSSGKTLLATVVSYLATGQPPAMLTQVDDPAAEAKRLLAVLLEGSPVVVIDNAERPLASAAMCSILTEPYYTDRVLGRSATATVATNATFLATGNGLAFEGDLSTRALVATLDPGCERPEEREFDVDLHQDVPARRGELVAAALTIPLAYMAVGSPAQEAPPFGRFETWAKRVRDPLLWLGQPDPCETRKRIEARDPVREDLLALLSSWHAVFGSEAIPVAAAVALKADGEQYTALRSAFEAIASKGREIDTRKLGAFLSKHDRRRENGLRFERYGERNGVALWRVVP